MKGSEAENRRRLSVSMQEGEFAVLERIAQSRGTDIPGATRTVFANGVMMLRIMAQGRGIEVHNPHTGDNSIPDFGPTVKNPALGMKKGKLYDLQLD